MISCMYCNASYENQEEFEIHSFVHSPCGEETTPVIDLIEINRMQKLKRVQKTIGKYVMDYQVDSRAAQNAVEESNLIRCSGDQSNWPDGFEEMYEIEKKPNDKVSFGNKKEHASYLRSSNSDLKSGI